MDGNGVEDYYGRVLTGTADLKTSACCTVEAPAPRMAEALGRVHDGVRARYYGCGLVAPDKLEGLTIVDLGCGAGQDAYVLAQFVGAKGRVIGVDMTEAQLAVARAHEDYHVQAFGYAQKNTTFLKGRIEELAALGVGPESADVIVSNCVVNLTENKTKVFAEVYAALKPGGEFYFSDVYADRRLDPALIDDQVQRGECLAGALYWNDFLTIARRAGFGDPRLVTARAIEIHDAAIANKLAPARFYSATYRLFKLGGLEPACEDYGQAVIYRGDIVGAPHAFELDAHHRIETGRVFRVCGNSWRMLAETRFAPHFEFIGDFSRHFGLFEGCGASSPFDDMRMEGAAKSGCC